MRGDDKDTEKAHQVTLSKSRNNKYDVLNYKDTEKAHLYPIQKQKANDVLTHGHFFCITVDGSR